MTQDSIDPDLAETIVNISTDTVHWLRGRGVRFLANYGRQAFNHNGRFKFFGGVVIYANGGGVGLVQSLDDSAAKHGIEVRFRALVTDFLYGLSWVASNDERCAGKEFVGTCCELWVGH